MNGVPPAEALKEFYVFTDKYPNHHNPVLYRQAIRAHADLNEIPKAIQLFEHIKKSKKPTLLTYAAIIEVCKEADPVKADFYQKEKQNSFPEAAN